jgi:uncharacterized protein (DUF427 family)
MIQIVIYDADQWKVLKTLWTDEKPQDVIKAVEDHVACYDSRKELEAANTEEGVG